MLNVAGHLNGSWRGQDQSLWWMAQHVSLLICSEETNRDAGQLISNKSTELSYCSTGSPASEGGSEAIFRDVVNTGGGVLRTSTSWFFIDQCH